MKIVSSRLSVLLQCLFAAIVLSACGGGGGSDSSAPVTSPGATALPTIIAQPKNTAVFDGSPATFSISYGGQSPLSVQWLRSGVPIQGATDASYVFTATLSDSGAQFSVVLTNPGGTVTSQVAVLTVTVAPPTPPAPPQSFGKTVVQGSPVTFSAAATVSAPVLVQWQRSDDDGVSWATVPNATALSVTIPHAALTDAGALYRADISDASGTRKTEGVRLNVRGRVGLFAGALGGSGYFDGPAETARFAQPTDVAVGPGGILFVYDYINSAIRKIAADGTVTTHARIPAAPSRMVADAAGNLYFGTSDLASIKKLSADGSTLTTVAGGTQGFVDGTGAAAKFLVPTGFAIDGGGTLFVADKNNNAIRKITAAGVVTTVVGALGSSTEGLLNQPMGIAIAPNGDLLIADSGNHVVRRITGTGVASTVAGQPGVAGATNGAVGLSTLWWPTDVAVNAAGEVFIADHNNHVVRKVSVAGVTSTLAGAASTPGYANGSGALARFRYPEGLTVDAGGNVFVTEEFGHTIRRITPLGLVTKVAGSPPIVGSGNGNGPNARFQQPRGIAVGANGVTYVSDTFNHVIRAISPNGDVSTLAGRAGVAGYADGAGTASMFNYPRALTIDASGNLYVADEANFLIRKVSPAGVVSTVAGTPGVPGRVNGEAANARFAVISAIAVDSSGNIFVNDHGIRKISAAGLVSNYVGYNPTSVRSDGPVASAQFGFVNALAIDSADTLYVGSDNSVRKISAAGITSTLATYGFEDSNPNWALFGTVYGLTIDATGNVYATSSNDVIVRISPAGHISAIVGANAERGSMPISGLPNQTVRLGADALVHEPGGIAVTPTGRLVFISQNSVLQTD